MVEETRRLASRRSALKCMAFGGAGTLFALGSGDVGDHRRHVGVPGEPRLHRVPVGRDHVGEVLRQERPHMRADESIEHRLPGSRRP